MLENISLARGDIGTMYKSGLKVASLSASTTIFFPQKSHTRAQVMRLLPYTNVKYRSILCSACTGTPLFNMVPIKEPLLVVLALLASPVRSPQEVGSNVLENIKPIAKNCPKQWE